MESEATYAREQRDSSSQYGVRAVAYGLLIGFVTLGRGVYLQVVQHDDLTKAVMRALRDLVLPGIAGAF